MTRVVALAVVCACAPSAPAPISQRSTFTGTQATVLPVARKTLVHFESNAAGLSKVEREALEALAQRLRADPALTLQISGHTDPTETDADNTGPAGLSHARAIAVQSFLIAQGIGEHRLLIRAVGSTEPRDTNATDAGRGNNRRVEFETVTIKINPFGGRVVITDSDVEILDPVTFEPGRVKLEKTSFPALDAVAATLHGNPSIQLVEVQSHVDERGDDNANLRLTQARAKIVVAYLVSKGIDAARLDAQGYGETQPLDRGHNADAWAKNTRIAFVIVKRTP